MSCGSEVYFSKILNGEEIYSYSGAINAGLINLSLSEIENILTGIPVDQAIRKKTFNILVECLQNQYHHSDSSKLANLPNGEVFGMFSLIWFDNALVLRTGNYVKKEKKEFLRNKIEKINHLSAEELKDLYKFILNHQKMSAKGGGGLGFIDVARKSGNPLIYEFVDNEDDTCMFLLEIHIS
jgi:hypothetical protein